MSYFVIDRLFRVHLPILIKFKNLTDRTKPISPRLRPINMFNRATDRSHDSLPRITNFSDREREKEKKRRRKKKEKKEEVGFVRNEQYLRYEETSLFDPASRRSLTVHSRGHEKNSKVS